MTTFLPLSALGPRIMICGPSNSGKSTLALALAKRIDAEVHHLDLMRHQPGTDWVQRPDDEFQTLHDAALSGERWVMEGNYSKLMPQRFARATGITSSVTIAGPISHAICGARCSRAAAVRAA